MNWYYTREPGSQGQILNDEGNPPGTPLSKLLQHGVLPIGVALEVIACLAEILTIAEEDNAVHGDIKPGDVFVAANGSVSLEGYGTQRNGGRAPEERPQGASTDVYGLGIVLHAALSNAPMGAVPKDRDGHDDAIVDRLLAIDWSDMDDLKGRDPVIHFLCSMLAYEPRERPAALDVANILSEVSAQLGGTSVEQWAKTTISAQASGSSSTPTVEEVLSGPAELGRVFNKTGQYSRRRQSAAAKGECTAFWSRDKIDAMLDEGADHLGDSQMFSREHSSRKPPIVPEAEPPRVIRSAPSSMPKPSDVYPDEIPWSPDATISGRPDDEELKNVISKLRAAQDGVSAPPGPPPSPVVGSEAPPPPSPSTPHRPPPPVAAPAATSGPPPIATVGRTGPVPARPKKGSGKPIPWIPILIGAVLVLLLFLATAVSGLAWYVLKVKNNSESVNVEMQDVEVEEEIIEKPPPAKPVTKREKPRTRPKKTATPRPATKRTKASKAAPSPTAAPPPSGAFDVTFKAMGAEAYLECGDGQTGRFTGLTRRKFTSRTACKITIDDASNAVMVQRSSTVICAKSGSTVTCSGG
ncbi:MAG: hypothetical protein ACPGTU_08970 [Myxococcota bacterium]